VVPEFQDRMLTLNISYRGEEQDIGDTRQRISSEYDMLRLI
jgi:hypothetical protein